jgi:hypothetical protein
MTESTAKISTESTTQVMTDVYCVATHNDNNFNVCCEKVRVFTNLEASKSFRTERIVEWLENSKGLPISDKNRSYFCESTGKIHARYRKNASIIERLYNLYHVYLRFSCEIHHCQLENSSPTTCAETNSKPSINLNENLSFRDLVKILDDLKECCIAIDHEFPNSIEEIVKSLASNIVDFAFDQANDSDDYYYKSIVDSEIFQFTDKEKLAFINATKTHDRSQVEFYELWAAEKIPILLNTKIEFPVTVISEGICYDISNFKITFKSGISILDFYIMISNLLQSCLLTIEHIESVDSNEPTIRVVISN